VHRVKILSASCVLLYTLQVFSTAQQSRQQQPLPTPGIQQGGPADNTPNVPPQFEREMQKKANQQRQAELKRDTEKLLKLSTELKEYVDKTNSNVLSMDVIKKAEEIEKLAHSVRVKMRGE